MAKRKAKELDPKEVDIMNDFFLREGVFKIDENGNMVQNFSYPYEISYALKKYEQFLKDKTK